MCRASPALDGVSALGVQCAERKKSPASTQRGEAKGGFPMIEPVSPASRPNRGGSP